MSDVIEVELLKQAAAGDYDAFDELHLLLEPGIRRFVGRLIGYSSEVDDIVQDTFLSLYLNMHKIDPPENLRPYVFRIARNRCYDNLRRDGRYERVSLDEEPVHVRVSFEVADADPSPEDITHWLLLGLEVREAMDHLPEMQRQTLILYSEEEMSYAEIAEVMEVSIGTVKSRLFHAKKMLRRLVRPETLNALNEEPPPDPTETDPTGNMRETIQTDNDRLTAINRPEQTKENNNGRSQTGTTQKSHAGAQVAAKIHRPLNADEYGGGNRQAAHPQLQ